MTKKRARSAEDKEVRKKMILDAAWDLYTESGGKLPTVLNIANRTGLSKGAIYLYFKSKEEIFLSQSVYQLREWYQDIEASLAREERITARSFAQLYLAYVMINPNILKISSLIKGVLEENIGSEFDYKIKKDHAELLLDAAKNLARFIPGKDLQEASRFLVRAYSLVCGLWQVTNISLDVYKRLMNDGIDIFQPSFQENAIDAVRLLFAASFGIE